MHTLVRRFTITSSYPGTWESLGQCIFDACVLLCFCRELVHTVSLAPLDMTTLERPLALERDTVGIDDPPGNHQHCLCAWVNLSGPRAAMSGPSGGDARDARDPRNAAAKNSRGAMDERTRNPWISSRLVSSCRTPQLVCFIPT